MSIIYKYTLERIGINVLELPNYGTIIRHVETQHGYIRLWIEHDEISRFTGKEHILEQRVFKIYGTGWGIPDNSKYIGTVLDGEFVWHVYELLEQPLQGGDSE